MAIRSDDDGDGAIACLGDDNTEIGVGVANAGAPEVNRVLAWCIHINTTKNGA